MSNLSMVAAEFIQTLQEDMPPEVLQEFRPLERRALLRAMSKCGLDRYPDPIEGDSLDRASGMAICETCKNEYADHPADWLILGYNNRPIFVALCDGRRVKL